jgi:hypothetical protein
LILLFTPILGGSCFENSPSRKIFGGRFLSDSETYAEIANCSSKRQFASSNLDWHLPIPFDGQG